MNIHNESFLQSAHYRGTLNFRYIPIPEYGVAFFTLFLDDIHQRLL